MNQEIKKRLTKTKVEKKESDYMLDLENDHIEDLLLDLSSHIRVVGGFGLTDSLMKMNIEELTRHLFPNGIEFRIHNRRLIPDPLKED